MSPALHRAAPRMVTALSALTFLSLLSCGREVTGPEARRLAMLALAPEFSGPMSAIDGAGAAVPFERVRVLLRRDDGSIIKDTVVEFPSEAQSVALTLTVPIPQNAPADGFPLTVAMAYVNAAGDTVFRGGPSPLVARPIGAPGASEPVSVPVTYDGPGKDAVRVAITPKSGTAVSGQTTAFAASAFDNANQPIASTPFIFSSVDTTRALVNPVSGVATWRPVRGTARVVAQLPNGLRADTATFTIALPASKLVLATGSAQTGAVNAPLADTIVLRTLASDDVPVEGVIVSFTVATGGGALSVTTDTSDAEGKVKTRWTLGGTLGTQSITATSAGLTGSPLTVSATATAATPVRLEIQAQPSSGVAGTALAPALTVIARDAFGNAVPTFRDSVIVRSIGTNPPPVAGTVRRVPDAGTTTFNDLSLTLAGDVRLIVSSGVLAPDTTTAITIAPAAPAALAIISGPPSTVTAGAALGATIRVRDAFGNVVPTASEPIAVSFDASPAGASFLGGNAPVVPTLGVAVFTALQLGRAGTYRLRFTSGALAAAVTTDFVVGAAAADTVFAQAGDAQTATAGTLLPTAVAVAVRDTFNNPVPGVSVAWAVTSGSGTVDSATSVTSADGRATVRWTLGGSAGAQTLRATVTGLSAVNFTATATAGTPAQVVFTQAPTSGSVADSLSPIPRVEIRDALGNRVPTYTGAVLLSFGSNPSGATLSGTTTVNAVAGVASFPNVRIVRAGTGYTLVATAVTEELVSAPTPVFARTAAVASELVLVSGGDQSVPAGAALAQPFVVRVRDAFGNAVAGQAVRFARQPALASIADTVVVTDASGLASTTGVAAATAGSALPALRAAVDGVATPVDFTLTVTAGVAATVAPATISNDAQVGLAGDTLAPFRVRVTDAFGNPVSGVTVTWTPTSGGSFLNATSVTNASGEAESRPVAPLRTGVATFIAEASGLTGSPVAFTATLLNLPPSALAISVAPSPSIAAGVALTDFVVRTQSSIGEPTAFTDTIRVFIVNGPSGGRIIAGDTAVRADSAARFIGITFDRVGSYTLEFRAAGLDSVRSAPITVAPSTPATLNAVSGNAQSGPVTDTLPSPLVVELIDGFGNPVAGREVRWSVTSGDVTLTAERVNTDASGRAAAGVVLGDSASSATITATVGTLTPVAFTATVLAGDATLPIANTAPTDGTAGTALPAFSYILVDRFNNVATGYAGTATVTLQPVGGSRDPVIVSGDSVPVVDGIATWDSLIVTSSGQYRVIADFGPTLGTLVSNIITVDPAGPALLVNVSGSDQGAPVLETFASPLRAQVTDAYGNGIAGVNVNFNFIEGLASFVGVSSPSVPTDSAGFAEVSVAADTLAGTVTIGAFAEGLTPDSVVYALTVQAGTPAALVVTSAPDTVRAAIPTVFVAEVRDVYQNVVTAFTDSVFFTLSDAPLDGLLSGDTAVVAVAGVATFATLQFGTAGGYFVLIQSPDLAPASLGFDVIAGDPVQIQQVSGNGQTGIATLPLDTAFTVRVVDAALNPVPGIPVTWTVLPGSGGGLVEGLASTSVVTDLDGEVSKTFTPGTTIGTQTVRAAIAVDSVDFEVSVSEFIGSSTWTGAVDSVWSNPANWIDNRVPTASDSAVVSGSFGFAPTVTSSTTIRTLTISSFQPITLNATLTITNSVTGVTEGQSIACAAAGRLVLAAPDSIVATGVFACPVFVSSGRTVPGGIFVADSVIIDGSGELHVRDGDFINIDGDLRTADGGTLRLEGVESEVSVWGNAIFRSTPSVGAISGGRLVLYGGFEQDSTPTAFQPGTDHRTVLEGFESQSVRFADPDAGTGSYFSGLDVFKSQSSVTLLSDIPVQGTLVAADAIFVGDGALRTLRSRGASVGPDNSLAFDNVRWELADGDALDANLYNVSFAQISESGVPQLHITRDTGSVTLHNFIFDSSAVAPLYLRAEDSAPQDELPLRVTMSSPLPAFHAGAIDTIGGAQLLDWEAEASFVWTGALNSTWTNAANWSSFVAPSASSVVTVPSTATRFPAITEGPVTIRGLINQSDTVGVFLAPGVDLTVTDQLQLTPGGEGVSCQDATARLVIGGNATTVSGDILDCDVVATGGTASIVEAFFVNRNLRLEGDHALNVNAGTLSVQLNVTLADAASLVMDAPADSVFVRGSATFGGGANTLTGGYLQVGGNFNLTGAATFQASGTHLTDLWDSGFGDEGLRVINIGDPAAGALSFNDLTLSQGNRDVPDAVLTVNGNLQLDNFVTFTADSTVIVGGDLISPSSNSIAAPRVTLGGAYQFAGALLADTVEFAGATQAIPATVTGIPVRFPNVIVSGSAFAQTADLADTVYVDSTLVVRNGGTLTVGDASGPRSMHIGNTTFFGANLVTEDGGRLAMQSALAELRVFGSATFAGGDQTGLLTNGLLRVESGFFGNGTNTFVATDAHRTRLGGNGLLDFYSIDDDDGDLRFGHLEVSGGSFLATRSLTADTLVVDDGTFFSLVGEGQRLTVVGDVLGSVESGLDARHLTLGGRLDHDGGIEVDTLVLSGSAQVMAKYSSGGAEINYARVEVTGTVSTAVPVNETMIIGGDLLVRGVGSLEFNQDSAAATVAIFGGLATADSGVIRMNDLGTRVSVDGDAVFAGGSTAGLLVAGTLEIAGSLTQLSATSTSSYQAGGTHFTSFLRTGQSPTVTFTDPGFGAEQSRFNHFEIGVSIGGALQLASDVYASAQLLHSGVSPVSLQQVGGPRTLTTAGAAASFLTFDGVRWELGGSVAVDPAGLNQLSFINQDPTAVQFRVSRDGLHGDILLSGLSFSTAPTTGGRYLVVEDTVSNEEPLTVTVDGVTPEFHEGFAEALGEAVLVGWEAFIPSVTASMDGAALRRQRPSRPSVTIGQHAFPKANSAHARIIADDGLVHPSFLGLGPQSWD